jgi:hypothetical protein
MKVKIDLSKEGLAMFYRPYEIIGWDIVWNSPEAIGSGAVWKKTNAIMAQSDPGEKKTISRASVIFFLNRQVDLGFMGWLDYTGKGGHHRRYYPKVDMGGLVREITDYTELALAQLKAKANIYDQANREGPGAIYKGVIPK